MLRTGTMISLGASIVLGVAALLIARLWLPQTVPAHPAGHVEAVTTEPVVVARGPIAYGARLDPGVLTVVDYPASAAPNGAFHTIQAVIDQPGGAPIALTPLTAREPILPAALSGGGAKPTVAAAIAPGLRAYTIGINEVAGGGGHILPGDRVDVVLTYDLTPLAQAGAGVGGGKRLVSTVVLQDVRVLGMDLNADPNSTQAQVAHTATLEVSVRDAQRLALAAQAGTLSLALRRTGGAQIAAVAPVTLAAVGPAVIGRPRSRWPGPVRHIPAVGARGQGLRSMIIIHGDSAAIVEVPAERRIG